MKILKFFALGILLLVSVPNFAQINVNVGRPSWGPVVTTQEYYYIPDVQSYYDINAGQFIYLSNGSWVRARQLPPRYRNYNLNKGNIIVLNDYRGRSPYVHYKNHKIKYNKGNNGNHYGHRNGKGNGKRNVNMNGNHKDSEDHKDNGSHKNDENHKGDGNHKGKKGKN